MRISWWCRRTRRLRRRRIASQSRRKLADTSGRLAGGHECHLPRSGASDWSDGGSRRWCPCVSAAATTDAQATMTTTTTTMLRLRLRVVLTAFRETAGNCCLCLRSSSRHTIFTETSVRSSAAKSADTESSGFFRCYANTPSVASAAASAAAAVAAAAAAATVHLFVARQLNWFYPPRSGIDTTRRRERRAKRCRYGERRCAEQPRASVTLTTFLYTVCWPRPRPRPSESAAFSLAFTTSRTASVFIQRKTQIDWAP